MAYGTTGFPGYGMISHRYHPFHCIGHAVVDHRIFAAEASREDMEQHVHRQAGQNMIVQGDGCMEESGIRTLAAQAPAEEARLSREIERRLCSQKLDISLFDEHARSQIENGMVGETFHDEPAGLIVVHAADEEGIRMSFEIPDRFGVLDALLQRMHPDLRIETFQACFHNLDLGEPHIGGCHPKTIAVDFFNGIVIDESESPETAESGQVAEGGAIASAADDDELGILDISHAFFAEDGNEALQSLSHGLLLCGTASMESIGIEAPCGYCLRRTRTNDHGFFDIDALSVLNSSEAAILRCDKHYFSLIHPGQLLQGPCREVS